MSQPGLARSSATVAGVTALVGAVVILLLAGVSLGDTSAYLAYFALAVVLPGTLLHRLVAGHAGSLLEDLAWGSVVGLLFELLGWAVFTRAGINEYLWVWPAVTVAVFLAVPSLRRRWRRPVGAGRTHPLLAWATSVSGLLGTGLLASQFFPTNGVPPNGKSYFVDMPWHTGVAYESVRHVPLQTPEAAAEGTLHYHWFADAHFGAASLVSGVDIPTVVLRLGLVPLVFVMVATTVALAVKVTSRPKVAALAGLLVIATTLGPDFWERLYRQRVLFPGSPTGIYAVGVASMLIALVVDVLRSRQVTRPQLVLLAPLLMGCIGSKPSNLLLVLPATGLMLLWRLLDERRLDWSLVTLVVAMVVAIGVSLPLFASAGGSTLHPSLVQVRAWKGTIGPQTPLVWLLVTALVKGYLIAFLAVAMLLTRPLRGRAVAQFLAALTVVGFAEAWVISHPGLSQMFFWTTAAPYAAILAAWGLAICLEPLRSPRVSSWFAAAVAVLALAATTVLHVVTDSRTSLLVGWVALLLVVGAAVLLGQVLGVPLTARLVTVCLAAVAVTAPAALLATPHTATHESPQAFRLGQSRAAVWVAAHVPSDDLVATNSHCVDGRTRPHCDARSFWLSGYGGHRVLLEGWGVSPSALRKDLVDGYKAWRQPYHDQELMRLNDSSFKRPDSERLSRLYHKRGVRWLVADRSAGRVSDALSRYADVAYANDWVTVYRLDPARLAP